MNHPNLSNAPSRPNVMGDHGGASAFSVRDFYYIFFRHKWKIVIVFLAGIIAAAGFCFVNPPPYKSEARIMVLYVVVPSTDPSPAGQRGGDSRIQSPDQRGDSIINSEVQILTSFDLAERVADLVGPDKILAKLGGTKGDGTDRIRAAATIIGGLKVEAPGHSTVLQITYAHRDPAVVQPVLSAVIDTYQKRHIEVHQGVGVMDDYYSRQADEFRTRLAQTEGELKRLKTEAQIISVDDSKRNYAAEVPRIQAELMRAESELAERRAALALFQASTGTESVETTNSLATQNLPPNVVERFRATVAELNALERQLTELRSRYTEKHYLIISKTNQIALVEATKKQLEEANPGLAKLDIPLTAATNQVLNVLAENLHITGLLARIQVLNTQLNTMRSDANRLIDVEPIILELQRAKEIDEANYRFYVTKLREARMDETLGPGKITNLNCLQTPTPPARDTKTTAKILLVLMVFCSTGGFAWGFISDRFLNQSVKGVTDVERHLPAPLFISVPDFSWRPKLSWFGSSRKNGDSPTANGGPDPASLPAQEAPAQTALAPWDSGHKLRPYYEGLRDRLITFFEVREMRHKPKMVAVTGCANGVGVTTMAAGLAAALSETGDGKVLLVDMNMERGAAHPFYQGKPGCALSDALDDATRERAFVQDGLYLVSAKEQPKNQQLPTILPKRFAHLVPKMKASDYDYIIFDMPPVTQTSVTARLAGFMDMVLLVIESEKTGQEILKRTHALLNESRPNMGAILNKHRAYVPSALAQEL
jgi:uncharacterized protein involved in exopolysaccharide biosynthesis/Mrp family chromosome partitioning ATPase